MNTTQRPWTSALNSAVRTLVLCNSAASATENVIHAWDAIDAAARGEKPVENLAYARHHLRCADEMLQQYPTRAIRNRKTFLVELAELRVALEALGADPRDA